MLQAVAGAGASGTATFACSPAASQLAFLWDHQLCGKAFLPLGALLEVAAAAAAAALGDAELLPRQQQLLLSGAAVPGLVELSEDMAAPPLLLCTLSTRSGQLAAASSSAAGQRLCFSAQLGGAASSTVAPAADEQVPSSAKVRPAVLAWRSMYAAQLLQEAECWEQRPSLLKCFHLYWLQVVLLGNRHSSSSSNTKPLDMYASLAALSSKAADGFIMHPTVLQAATTDCGSSRVLAGIEAVCLPTAATAVGSTSWSAGGAAASLTAAHGSSLAATLHGMQWCAAQQLEPSLAASAQAIDLSDLVYQVEWQAADSLAGAAASAAIRQPQLALVSGGSSRGSARQLAALQLCQTASVAAADAVQLLHSHRSSQLKTVSLHTTGSLPAQHQLAPAQPAVGAAAIAGVMKNLPYEMPFMSFQLLDTEASSSSSSSSSSSGAGSRAHAMSAAPLAASLQADLYGVAARGGALHRPLLMYAAAGADSSGPAGEQAMAPVDGSSTYAITGGLGGLGMLTANWLAGSGARSLVLLSRSGQAASAGDAAAILHSPALVVVSKCDVSFSEDARLLAATKRAQSHRFGGIVHTAGLQVSAGCSGAGLGWAGLPLLSLLGTASAHTSVCCGFGGSCRLSWHVHTKSCLTPRIPLWARCRSRRGCRSRRCARCARPWLPSWARCRTAWMPPLQTPSPSPSSSLPSPQLLDSLAMPTTQLPTQPWTPLHTSGRRRACARRRCSGARGLLSVSGGCWCWPAGGGRYSRQRA